MLLLLSCKYDIYLQEDYKHSTSPALLPTFSIHPTLDTGSSVQSFTVKTVFTILCFFYMLAWQRPWHELENNFMIMFKVGMGGLPTVPEHLSDEGKDFLSHCFETDPRARWMASQLQNHPFVKVKGLLRKPLSWASLTII